MAKDRQKPDAYKRSILTDDLDHCYFCGKPREQFHHIFGGPSRLHSTNDDMIIPICWRCHSKIHDTTEIEIRRLQMAAQWEFEKDHTRDEFRARYGKSYLLGSVFRNHKSGIRMSSTTESRPQKGGTMSHIVTQCEMIEKHLREFGSITPGAALEEYGVFRLSARIADLKDQGLNIITESEIRRNRFGKKVRYARYRLEQQS